MNVITAGQQMLVMFLLIMTGYLCSRKGLINEQNNACLSSLVVNVFNPAVIFSSVLGNAASRTEDSLLTLFVVSAGLYLFLILAAKVLLRFSPQTPDEKHITELLYVFANVGFIGIPVVKSLLGDACLIYVAVFILVYSILVYTYGIALLQKEKASKGFRLASLKPLLNMGTLACAATLVVFVGNFRLPVVFTDTLQHLANATTPISLLIIGVSLGMQGNPLSPFLNGRRYLFCLWKLLLLPLAGTWILCRLPVSVALRQTYMLLLAMPSGNMILMIVKDLGLEEKECANTIILSTLLSILTIPVVVLIYPYL